MARTSQGYLISCGSHELGKYAVVHFMLFENKLPATFREGGGTSNPTPVRGPVNENRVICLSGPRVSQRTHNMRKA